jgi:uncharacterized protein YprB with RNaseH-like and TPR domain
MTLTQRLALLKGKHRAEGSLFDKDAQRDDGTGTPVTQSHAPLIPLHERLLRLHGMNGGSRKTADETRGRRHSDADVAKHLQGEVIAPGLIQVGRTIPLASRHGKLAFSLLTEMSFAALGLPDATQPGDLLFVDTETTGLAGGTGTLPFMVCLARIRENSLQLGQWVLTGFAAEAAMLRTIFEWIESAQHLVTYNGKSFDVPLLITRYRLARLPDPFSDKSAGKDVGRGTHKSHVDLLHLTRRACAHDWDDCRLQTAERRLLGFTRKDDFPSHLIPQAWAEFVRGGGVQPLQAIAEHNRHDVLSLAVLLGMLAAMYTEPGHEAANSLKIAQAHAARGNLAHAVDHLTGACGVLDQAALLFLAKLYRSQQRDEQAVAIWMRLRENRCVAAIETLAKYHEHVLREPAVALGFAEELLRLEPGSELHANRHARLSQRVEKLKRKLGRRSDE